MGLPIKSILKGAFPFIAAALSAGGPLGSMATGAIGTALGVDPKTLAGQSVSSVDSTVTQALAANPDAYQKLQDAEHAFQLQMTQLGYDQIDKIEALAAGDTANARAREIAIRDNTPKILAYVVVGATLFLEGFMLFHKIPMDLDPVILGRILGTLDMATSLVLGYYFGSSFGSKAKDETIAAQAGVSK